MYKYTYKGHDRAGVDVEHTGRDEIIQYLDARYVGPCEAIWRILEFPMHGRSHAVQRLPVHLPDQQQVFFSAEDTETAEAMAERMKASKLTKLTAYFALNAQKTSTSEAKRQDGEFACTLSYTDIPKHFTWDSRAQCWQRRQHLGRGDRVISQMYAVDFGDQERFWLRAVLLLSLIHI